MRERLRRILRQGALMSALRAELGDSLKQGIRATPVATSGSPSCDGSPYAWLQEQLTRLRNARRYNVAGIDPAQAVNITLPAARGRRIGQLRR